MQFILTYQIIAKIFDLQVEQAFKALTIEITA